MAEHAVKRDRMIHWNQPAEKRGADSRQESAHHRNQDQCAVEVEPEAERAAKLHPKLSAGSDSVHEERTQNSQVRSQPSSAEKDDRPVVTQPPGEPRAGRRTARVQPGKQVFAGREPDGLTL